MRKGFTTNRKRKPRDLAESIIMDRLEAIESNGKSGPLEVEEANFALQAYKTLSEAQQTDAESEYLKSLTPEQSNKLDDMLAELEEGAGASDN